MTPHELSVRRVQVLAWEDLRGLVPTDPSGTITHVVDCRAGDTDLTVQVEVLTRDFVFGLDEVQALPRPCPPCGATAAGSG
jgi:hypothetical protein